MSSTTIFSQQFHRFPPSPSHVAGYPRRPIPPPLSFGKFQAGFGVQETDPYAGGLRTPPAEDDMSATYHNPVVAGNTYDAHLSLARHPNIILPASRISSNGVVYDAGANPYARTQSQPQLQTQLLTNLPQRSYPDSGVSRTSTGLPTSAVVGRISRQPPEVIVNNADDSGMVMHSLKLPKCISPHGGSLDDFAALVGSSMLSNCSQDLS